jgi:hypothetical protein
MLCPVHLVRDAPKPDIGYTNLLHCWRPPLAARAAYFDWQSRHVELTFVAGDQFDSLPMPREGGSATQNQIGLRIVDRGCL